LNYKRELTIIVLLTHTNTFNYGKITHRSRQWQSANQME